MTYLKAVEAGADGIDTAISSFSGGTAQPPTETMNYAFKELEFNTGLDEKILKKINDHFKPLKDKFIESGQLNPFVLTTDTDALTYQVPGGMLSNLIAQLKQQKALDRLEEVLSEVPRVREDLGYPPLVTPMSQMVGAQAAANVLSAKRYKIVLKEVKAYVKGEYGKPPSRISDELIKKILGDETPLNIRFADTLEPQFETVKERIKDIAKTDEDVLTYILFPQIAEPFLKKKAAKNALSKEKTITYKIESL